MPAPIRIEMISCRGKERVAAVAILMNGERVRGIGLEAFDPRGDAHTIAIGDES
jgi:hypothetical protein